MQYVIFFMKPPVHHMDLNFHPPPYLSSVRPDLQHHIFTTYFSQVPAQWSVLNGQQHTSKAPPGARLYLGVGVTASATKVRTTARRGAAILWHEPVRDRVGHSAVLGGMCDTSQQAG
jgi:hypothetical protein